MEEFNIRFPFIKVMSAWSAIWLTSLWQSFSEVPWEILAQFVAFLYSAALLAEWVYKKIRRLRRGAD